MRRIYLLSVEELKEPGAFEGLLGQVCAARREKALHCAGREDQVRSLGAGLLLQYGLGAWDNALPGDEVPAGDDSLQCVWQVVSLERIRVNLPFERELTFHYGSQGKPYLDQSPLFFSLSHSGDYVACGISDCEIGVDIQQHRSLEGARPAPDLRLAARFFVEEEWQQLRDCREEEKRSDLFYRFWIRKEGFGKLTGEGLKAGLSVGSEQKMRELGTDFSYYDSLPGYSACACWYRPDPATP